MTGKSDINVVIQAHRRYNLAELAALYDQAAFSCDQKQATGEPLPTDDGHSDSWAERAQEARWIASELRQRV